jgi:hypothetical protein
VRPLLRDPSGEPAIERIKRLRLDARIVDDFDWSIYERAFDGARLDVRRRGWRMTALAVRPTQGGFEDAAGVGIDDIGLLSGHQPTLRPLAAPYGDSGVRPSLP